MIVTSPGTRRDLAAYDVEEARIGVVCPGTDPAPLARGSAGPGLGAAVRRLADAAQRSSGASGRAGGADRAGLASDLRRQHGARSGLRAVDRRRDRPPRPAPARDAGRRARRIQVAPFYDQADVFVLASYHEGYGMVLTEALARGLPLVATSAGAIPDTVPADAGLLVPPGDPGALASALRRVMTEPGLRARLLAGARAARGRLPGWSDAVRAFAAELAGLTGSAR